MSRHFKALFYSLIFAEIFEIVTYELGPIVSDYFVGDPELAYDVSSYKDFDFFVSGLAKCFCIYPFEKVICH